MDSAEFKRVIVVFENNIAKSNKQKKLKLKIGELFPHIIVKCTIALRI